MSRIQLIEKKISELSFDSSRIIIISGPTGIGKSELAISLAQKINGSIINADSMQIYKELKIISSQPSYEDKKIVSHYLYGIKSICHKFSVVEWLELVKNKVDLILSKNETPIIVGGTGLYIKSTLFGISKIPKVDDTIFEKCIKLFEKVGILEFRKIVEEIDENFISKNIDKQRLIRAYSVFLQTGKNITEWQENSEKYKLNNNFFSILLEQEREKNYKNCEKRFEHFVNNGAIEEVRHLKDKNFDRSLPGFKCLGVKWILKYLEKEIAFNDAISLSKRDTRRYIKRQLTWFKHNFNPDLIIRY